MMHYKDSVTSRELSSHFVLQSEDSSESSSIVLKNHMIGNKASFMGVLPKE
jgi:hypothetical protein